MQNPYSTPKTPPSSGSPAHLDGSAIGRRAGLWLCVAGVAHIVLMNVLPASTPLDSIDWSAGVIVLLGLAVYLEIRLAETIARLFGSFALVVCFLVAIIAFTGLKNGGTLNYGRFVTESPSWWQLTLVVSGIALTFGPPWYMLQIKLRPEESRDTHAENA